jgi:hypothetical protein
MRLGRDSSMDHCSCTGTQRGNQTFTSRAVQTRSALVEYWQGLKVLITSTSQNNGATTVSKADDNVPASANPLRIGRKKGNQMQRANSAATYIWG